MLALLLILGATGLQGCTANELLAALLAAIALMLPGMANEAAQAIIQFLTHAQLLDLILQTLDAHSVANDQIQTSANTISTLLDSVLQKVNDICTNTPNC